jgi:anthranilate synthase/aminodeoxychorismate synthase-like glutamine amidotransferase
LLFSFASLGWHYNTAMLKHVLIIDNYDSFTWNLVQAVGVLPDVLTVDVVRNDAETVATLFARKPTHLIISPGPKGPADAALSNDAITYWQGKIPILGVCLGHQCMAMLRGANIISAKRRLHGKTCRIYHEGKGLFLGIPDGFGAMRYNSLLVDGETIGETWHITAVSEENEIMAIQAKTDLIFGVQFHPESFATEYGTTLLTNFLLQ